MYVLFFLPLIILAGFINFLLLYFLIVITVIIIVYFLSNKKILGRIKKISDEHNRFYQLYLIKDRGNFDYIQYELEQLKPFLLSYKIRIRIPDNLIRILYLQIISILIGILIIANSYTKPKSYFYVKNKVIYYNNFTKNKVNIFIKTYGEKENIKIFNNKKKIFDGQVQDQTVSFLTLKEGYLLINNKYYLQKVPVNVLKPVKIIIKTNKKEYYIGEKVKYSIKIQGKYDTAIITIRNDFKKRVGAIKGEFILRSDTIIRAEIYKNKQIVGILEKFIKGIPNYPPMVKILKPGKDEEVDSFFGNFPIVYTISDDNGLKQADLIFENEKGKKYDILLKKFKNNRTYSDTYVAHLEDFTNYDDNLIYYFIKATDIWGMVGESKHYVISLIKKEELEEIFDSVQNEVFGDLQDISKQFEGEKLDSFSKQLNQRNEIKKIEESVKKIKRAADYTTAEAERLHLENELLKKIQKQMDLLKKILDERVLQLLQQKLSNSMNNKNINGKLSNEELKKIAFELEKMIRALKEYKKGLDAEKLAKKLDKLQYKEKKLNEKIEDIKADATDLFSQFNENDKKMLNPERAMYNLDKLNNEKSKNNFNKDRNKLSNQLKSYAKKKMEQQSSEQIDFTPLIKEMFYVDGNNVFFKTEAAENILSSLKKIDKMLKTIAARILMLDYSLYERFQIAVEDFNNFYLNHNNGYFNSYKTQFTIFENRFLDIMDKLMQQKSSCPNAGNSGQDIFNKLNQMAKDQKKLNKYMEELMKQLENSGLQKRLEQALSQAAKDQQKLEKELSKIKKDLEKEKEKGGLAGDPNSVDKKMKEIVKSLKGKKLDENTMRKAHKVYIQLLQMQQAIYQRKDESARYSKMGKFLQKWYPNKLKKPKKKVHTIYNEMLKELTK